MKLYILIVLIAILAGYLLNKRLYDSHKLPDHLLNHKSMSVPKLLDEEMSDRLWDTMKEIGSFPTNSDDLLFYTAKHDNIGEAEPINSDGSCNNKYFVPAKDRKRCILPGRIDVGRHYITYGGILGLKETFEQLVSRALGFGHYMFDLNKYPPVRELFNSPHFQKAAKAVCPETKQYLDPFQFNFIIAVPGQTVPLHVDGVYFWGSSRFQVPQWLLAVMQFSGLFQDRFIDQVQLVGYVHKWQDKSRYGQFVYWNNNNIEPETVDPIGLSGIGVDGSKTVHAATVYRPDIKPPLFDKSTKLRLNYDGNDQWYVSSNDNRISNYTTDDLRVSIVYRAKCFKDEAEAKLYNDTKDTDIISLNDILNTLRDDLIKRKRVTLDHWNILSAFEKATFMLDEYVRYPLPPKSIIPFNYCALKGSNYQYIDQILQYLC